MPVRGSCNQANALTPGMFGGGSQCTSIALAALILSSILAPGHWSTDVMDHVMGQGVYRYLVDTHFNGNHTAFIGHDQLPQDPIHHSIVISILTFLTLFWG